MSWNPIGDAPANPYEIVEASSNYTIQNGELVFAESGVELTFPQPEPDGAIGVASVDGKPVDLVPQSGAIESEAERKYNKTEVSYFVSDGTDWYAVSNRELLNFIPDSEADQKLRNRWLLDDVNGTVEDSEGGEDGTNNGVTSVSGNWAGGSAGQGDGDSDYIELTDLGSFGSSLDTNIAAAFSVSIDNDEDTLVLFGIRTSDDLRLQCRIFEGHPQFFLRATNFGARMIVESDNELTVGEQYRIVFNKTGNDDSDIEIYINGSESSTTIIDEGQVEEVHDFDRPVALFAENNVGDIRSNFEGIIDDACLFDSDLTDSEIASYNNPWN